MHKIALIEDDESLGYILKEYLQLNDYIVTWLKSGGEALKEILRITYDLLIIDVNLPDFDGFELAEKLTIKDNRTPFIFLTARRLKTDKLKGFKLGGEDFIVKPVDEEELLARINVVLRRSKSGEQINDDSKISIGDISFSPKQLAIQLPNDEATLTEMEAELFGMLCRNKNQLVSRRDIMHKIWKEDTYFTRRSMDVFMSRLRKVLMSSQNVSIKTVHGRGYILSDRS